jgi:uncharacterized protein (DUF924 family)
MKPQSILPFWFEKLTAKQHFVKVAALDETIRARFGDTLEAEARGNWVIGVRFQLDLQNRRGSHGQI